MVDNLDRSGEEKQYSLNNGIKIGALHSRLRSSLLSLGLAQWNWHNYDWGHIPQDRSTQDIQDGNK